jgi:lipopolysaccharide transport protein LptA
MKQRVLMKTVVKAVVGVKKVAVKMTGARLDIFTIFGSRIGIVLYASVCWAGLLTLQPMQANAVELPTLNDQDTIVVTADQAWESDDGNVLNFQGNFELTSPDYYLRSERAEIHGQLEDPDRIVATGDPVTFWVRDTNSDERTHGQGNRVEYQRDRNLLRLSGNAILEGENTVMRSSLLEYNTQTERLVSTGTDGVEIVTQPLRH